VEEYYDITNCNKEALNSIASELYKRIIKPLFIIIVSLIVSFLIYFPKEHYFIEKINS
jgi:lipopolysaccharide export LptBFGC system permease protein LptF